MNVFFVNGIILLIGMLLYFSKGHFDPNNLYPIEKESIQLLPENIEALLHQPFTYLGEGAQVYAFAGQDQKTVLKLFKAKHQKKLTPARFLRHLKKNTDVSKQKWTQKFHDTCRRYETAFIHLKKETGLLYLHFAKTSHPLPLILIDKYTHKIDLANHPFILQKKAELAPAYFKKHPEKLVSAKQALKELFITRTKKGYTDPRQSLNINYGFVGDEPIQIDVGKIEPFSGDIDAEIEKIHAHIDNWLSRL